MIWADRMDQFKNCFAVWRCKVTESEDPTNSYQVTKYQELIKKMRTWICKRRAPVVFRDLF